MTDAQPPAVTSSFDRYSSPQVGLAFYLVTIGAMVVVGVWWKGSPELFAATAGMVIGATIGAVSTFAFGSSKGSQDKTATSAATPASLPPAP